ncbi:hypothetical protein BJ684DRAFT_21783 [Piptocephalis cylindrospora]|uniref:Uncharacterized protein n=1 Tax=Piptocephalis cylindrospora TaxID=1907219 RepID=A0A4P9Y0S4_9FUNG|nr:hypothetical protein BJ684DRAFT_21783 [Piptocephalis cylindrospora]|eukprot:RKP11641.1 hypothetical protein BJ684DRAFT_21783 [Piptocephalis cylindrospora]
MKLTSILLVSAMLAMALTIAATPAPKEKDAGNNEAGDTGSGDDGSGSLSGAEGSEHNDEKLKSKSEENTAAVSPNSITTTATASPADDADTVITSSDGLVEGMPIGGYDRSLILASLANTVDGRGAADCFIYGSGSYQDVCATGYKCKSFKKDDGSGTKKYGMAGTCIGMVDTSKDLKSELQDTINKSSTGDIYDKDGVPLDGYVRHWVLAALENTVEGDGSTDCTIDSKNPCGEDEKCKPMRMIPFVNGRGTYSISGTCVKKLDKTKP